jgi:glutamyl-tRNA synthetase
MTQVRTRFAPSPTGSLHIGSLRTALFSYALAKHYKGDFLLRIEDTDKKREVKGSREEIKSTLKDFSLDWDEYYIQSERVKTTIYKKAADQLVKIGHAFYCQCKAKNVKKGGYSKKLRDSCREKDLKSGAIKLKVPDNGKVSFTDFVLEKQISWEMENVADTTLLKSNGFPTYHLAVVVDDSDMKVSHALRGYDWLPSTPIHLLVYKYLNLEKSKIGHLTDILDPEGGKLSKRKGSISVTSILNDGCLPEALLNFLMLLGWAPKDNQEFFTLDQFIKVFDERGLQKSNPVFNREKLLWMNGEYIRKSKDSVLSDRIYDYYKASYSKDRIAKAVPIVKSRIKTLKEFSSLAGFLFEQPKVDTKLLGKNCQSHLKVALETIKGVSGWRLDILNDALIKAIKKNKFQTGDFFMDLRISVSGNRKTPPINESIVILGKNETIKRLGRIVK